jgi:hypothetical protein
MTIERRAQGGNCSCMRVYRCVANVPEAYNSLTALQLLKSLVELILVSPQASAKSGATRFLRVSSTERKSTKLGHIAPLEVDIGTTQSQNKHWIYIAVNLSVFHQSSGMVYRLASLAFTWKIRAEPGVRLPQQLVLRSI